MNQPSPIPDSEDGDRLVHAELAVFADDWTITVRDAAAPFDATARPWIQALLRDFVAAQDGAIGITTARPVRVPLTIGVRSHEPAGDDLERWDHVVETGLHTPTGRLITSPFPRRPTIRRPSPSHYAARVHHAGLGTVSPDGLDGDDRYYLVLWPDIPRSPRVLKRYPHSIGG
ncbi:MULTISPECIES: hypothetical protein [Prauserella salsuginis group]|uniref:Uncharacterized protein n=1 Tax=Prauserella salsuginis TaxID=387889 RepID=A0ABW6G020_9PSEU|nr:MULTISPECIES: hypothetical protein [Prauserella salsuginis group]MCR3721170.1 hypothetical protein [Prauserella flava]MCR3734749.1 hypothetical protein [Prauserella salsuginis]